jgi:hypothetical protein
MMPEMKPMARQTVPTMKTVTKLEGSSKQAVKTLEALTRTRAMKLERSWRGLTTEVARMPEALTRIAATKRKVMPKELATTLVEKLKAIQGELTMAAGKMMPLMKLAAMMPLSYQEAQAVAIRHL